jgi:hypothetical protein
MAILEERYYRKSVSLRDSALSYILFSSFSGPIRDLKSTLKNPIFCLDDGELMKDRTAMVAIERM